MHHWDQQVASEEFRKLLVGDATAVDSLEKCRRYKDEAGTRPCQTPVNLTHEWLTQNNILLAEPHRYASGLQKSVQFCCRTVPVVPSVAKEDVP